MSAVSVVLEGDARDLGDGLFVRRALPQRLRRVLGPFVFWDHLGPATLRPGHGMDVRPHPHIGLATVTYLLEGALQHRDTLGVVARIARGDVAVMQAGRGIVHSERTPAPERTDGHALHAIQAWIALPAAHEEDPPAFHHVPAAVLPRLERDGVELAVLLGTSFGQTSPVPVLHPTLYVEARLAAGATLTVPTEHEDRGVYVVDGTVRVDGLPCGPGRLVVLAPGLAVDVTAPHGAHVMLLGGAPLDGDRFLWWNFVSSRRERIAQAERDWRESAGCDFVGSVFTLPAGEHEHIPLPGDPPAGPPGG